MLRTILATLAVATTLVAAAMPSNMAKGLVHKPKASAVSTHVGIVKAVKPKDCGMNCDQQTCPAAASCDGCPLTSCGN